MAIDVKTGEERQLTKLGGYNGGVDYSPDGKRIAFHRADDKRAEIWVMDSDGANPNQVTDTLIDEYSPAWSPDGNWIAYTAGTESDGNGTFDLWLMLPDGSGARIISTSPNTQMNPKWRFGKHYCR